MVGLKNSPRDTHAERACIVEAGWEGDREARKKRSRGWGWARKKSEMAGNSGLRAPRTIKGGEKRNQMEHGEGPFASVW